MALIRSSNPTFRNAVFTRVVPGAGAMTLGGTIAKSFMVLVLYGMRVIRVTGRVRATIVNATCAVFAYYLLDLVIWVIDGARMPLMVSSSTASLVFSLFVAALAAANLVLDFDVIEEGIKKGAPKYLEWYAGFSLLVTLIWIYLELLRLLRKLRNR